MVRTEHRPLDPDYDGPVFIWDIDKTYLETQFSKFKDLIKIPLEFAVDKKTVPGVIELLHGVRAGPEKKDYKPIYFVSASPNQIHNPIERKMLLDGVQHDGITFKDWARLIRRRQFSQLKNQTAYKLAALMTLTADLPLGCRLILFGDDAEADALIYSIFADVCAGHLRGNALEELLRTHGVPGRYRRSLVQFAAKLPTQPRVERIYIRLFRCPDGSSIKDFDGRIVGWPSAVAAAQDLVELNLMHPDYLAEIRENVPQSERKYGRRDAIPNSPWL